MNSLSKFKENNRKKNKIENEPKKIDKLLRMQSKCLI